MSRCCCGGNFNYRWMDIEDPIGKKKWFLGIDDEPDQFSQIVLDVQVNEVCERFGVIGYDSNAIDGGFYAVRDLNDGSLIFEGNFKWYVGGLYATIGIDDDAYTYLQSNHWEFSGPTFPDLDGYLKGVVQLDPDGNWLKSKPYRNDNGDGMIAGYDFLMGCSSGYVVTGPYKLGKFDNNLDVEWVTDTGGSPQGIKGNYLFAGQVFSLIDGSEITTSASVNWGVPSESSNTLWGSSGATAKRFDISDLDTPTFNFQPFGSLSGLSKIVVLPDGGMIATSGVGGTRDQIRRYDYDGNQLWSWYMGDWKHKSSGTTYYEINQVYCMRYAELSNRLIVGSFNSNTIHQGPA